MYANKKQFFHQNEYGSGASAVLANVLYVSGHKLSCQHPGEIP